MNVCELYPADNHKSFYGKALVITANGKEVLQSYSTTVAYRDQKGKLHRTWSGWSATTGRHIHAFCGLRKAEWDKLPVEPEPAI